MYNIIKIKNKLHSILSIDIEELLKNPVPFHDKTVNKP
jgi:hypothetical protein